jgi:hypothetical protein
MVSPYIIDIPDDRLAAIMAKVKARSLNLNGFSVRFSQTDTMSSFPRSLALPSQGRSPASSARVGPPDSDCPDSPLRRSRPSTAPSQSYATRWTQRWPVWPSWQSEIAFHE